MDEDAAELLFVYGLFTRPELQLDAFGRRVETSSDVLPGYRLGYADFELPLISAVSGGRRNPVARETGDPRDKVIGAVLVVTPEELEAADEYAAPTFRRVRATLAGGVTAWVYVAAAVTLLAD